MSTMKQYAKNLLELRNLTNKDEDFEKSPQGYALRERACLVQLCLHENKIVRKAAAELPILRDMFVIAMYEQEEDKKIKASLKPRYLDAITKENQRDIELEHAQSEVARLQSLLDKATKK